MGTIVISENVTLDGFVEDPTGETGFTYGGWFSDISDADREAWAIAECNEALAAEVLLLGRRTYEFFASRWPSRAGAWADRLNTMPKYVVSSTLTHLEWQNSMVLPGDLVREVAELRRRVAGEVVVYGSRRLVQTLLEHGLADEVRLIVFPVVLGAGERLFGDAAGKASLRRLDAAPLGADLTRLTYRLVNRPAPA